MDDQLDNDLKNHIREVFDNFEDPTADEGWLLLREKFSQSKKRPVVWLWWGSAAAVALLFLGVGLWLGQGKKINSGKIFSAKNTKSQHPQVIAADSAHQFRVNNTKPVTDTRIVVKQPVKTGGNHSTGYAPNQPGANQIAASGKAVSQAPATSAIQNTTAVNTPVIHQSENSDITRGSLAAKKPDSTAVDSKTTLQQQYAVNTPAVKPADVTVNNNTVNTTNTQPLQVKPKLSGMDALFASDNNQPKKTEKPAVDKRVRFGIYAATFFNYAKGSDNQVNAGAGITSDISISKRLKLSTGLAYAQNNLNFTTGIPPNSRVAESTPALLVSQQSAALFSKSSGSPVFKNYNASLAGLDVPINLKYEFNPGKNDTYISAGLSSGTFINESYTAKYSYPSLAEAAGVEQQTTQETTRNGLGDFYFGKTLNLSFGMGYSLGNGNRLIIEPFLKYPLDGLGAQEIKFGAGGLNLKINFTTHKK